MGESRMCSNLWEMPGLAVQKQPRWRKAENRKQKAEIPGCARVRRLAGPKCRLRRHEGRCDGVAQTGSLLLVSP